MKRQRIFMDAAVPMIREKIDESSGFITTMLDTIDALFDHQHGSRANDQ